MDELIFQFTIPEHISLLTLVGESIRKDAELICSFKKGTYKCSQKRMLFIVDRAKRKLDLFRKISGEQYEKMLDAIVL